MPKFPKIALTAAIVGLSAPSAVAAQHAPIATESTAPSPAYADYADLVVAAPVIVDATIRSTVRLKPTDSAGLPPSMARLYVEADVSALIRGTDAMPARLGYTLDVPLDAHGRAPQYRKSRVLLFARAVPDQVGQIQLIRPDAQRGWSAAGDALTRRIVRETLAPDAPPTVTGIANAFHTPGDLPGSGETQIFLSTADNRPISLTIERKAGEAPRWSVALSEVVDAAAPPPPRDTLLWYRLACSLPATLPDAVLHSSGDDATVAREDYALVITALGACDRGRRS